jgi:aminoglycoside phosphotransferase (APT) family kinase protein
LTNFVVWGNIIPMDSLTKISLNPADLCRIVSQAFGPGVDVLSSQELTDGWFNTIHALELSDGQSVVLKVAPKADVPVLRYEKRLMAAEVAVLQLLSMTPGTPVPRVLFHDSRGEILGLELFFMEKVKAPAYSRAKESLTADQKRTFETDLGRVNRCLNAVMGTAFGSVLPDGRRTATWSETILTMVTDLLADARDLSIPLPRTDETILGLVHSRVPDLDRVTEPHLVHWDLHDANAFLAEDGTVAAIIDGDRALWGDPLMELYFAPFMDKSAFLEGYGSDILHKPGADSRRRVYDLYLGLVMVIECTYRQFTDPGHLAWTAAQLEKALVALED